MDIFIYGLYVPIQRSTNYKNSSGKLSKKRLSQRLNLQGDKKIVLHVFLKLNIIKAVLLGLPLCLTIVGIYFLIKSRSLRSKVLFEGMDNFEPDSTTHVYLETNDKEQELVKIHYEQYGVNKHWTFFSCLLKYEIIGNYLYPVGYLPREEIADAIQKVNKGIFLYGWDKDECKQKLQLFGQNKHRIQIPGFVTYSANVMSEPLFIFQYLILLNWYLHNLVSQTFILLGFLLGVVIINYIFLYFNLKKIREMAEKNANVMVLREGKYAEVKCTEIIPGDIYKVGNQIPCDSIIISGGQVTVNEASYTGQNLPILKTRIRSDKQIMNKSHWIIDGSEIIQKQGDVMAMAVYTGFTSHRGRIIRKILKSKTSEPQFTKSIISYSVITLMITSIIFVAVLPQLNKIGMTPGMMVSQYFYFVSFSVNFVGFIQMFPTFSLRRLKKLQIDGKQPYSVYESGAIKTICFDKTGTLTSNELQIDGIYKTFESSHQNMTNKFQEQLLFRQIFACCNMIKVMGDDQVRGDEIDVQMFKRSTSSIKKSSDGEVLWSICFDDEELQVLRINQFQSKFMSLSVLVRNRKTGEIYIFVKGAPEVIMKNATNNCNTVPGLLKRLSMQGKRVIALGYKRISKDEFHQYLCLPRQKFLQKTRLIGLVSFLNHLKEDSRGVVQRLRNECGIGVKMITGDNILTAVRAAFSCGIIQQTRTVAICEKQNIIEKDTLKLKVILVSLEDNCYHEKEQIQESFVDFLHNSHSDIVFAIDSVFLRREIFTLEGVSKIRVFARMSPEDKTNIVKNITTLLIENHQEKSFISRLFGAYRTTVGMVGDGANDLMAIKQADVGIAINESDGTFSADFVIKKLADIQKIIRQGKSVNQRAMEAIQIGGSTVWLTIPLMLLMLHDSSIFSQISLFLRSAIILIPIQMFISVIKPLTTNSKLIPITNYVQWRNMFRVWTTSFIFTGGFILIYVLLWVSPEYIPIQHFPIAVKTKLLQDTQASTVFTKIILSYIIGIIVVFYDGQAFKEPLLKNNIIKVWFVICLILALVTFFFSSIFPQLNLVKLGLGYQLVIFGILVGCTLLSYILARKVPNYYEGIVLESSKQEQGQKQIDNNTICEHIDK